MNLLYLTADLAQSRSFGGVSADCRRILADQHCKGSYHHGDKMIRMLGTQPVDVLQRQKYNVVNAHSGK